MKKAEGSIRNLCVPASLREESCWNDGMVEYWVSLREESGWNDGMVEYWVSRSPPAAVDARGILSISRLSCFS